MLQHHLLLSVSHTSDVWNLHIKSVKIEDSGGYVCQINTDPMKAIVSTSYSIKNSGAAIE